MEIKKNSRKFHYEKKRAVSNMWKSSNKTDRFYSIKMMKIDVIY